MRKIILLVALVLWACGAPNQVEQAAAQENSGNKGGGRATQSDTEKSVKEANPYRPRGPALPAGIPTPQEVPDLWREVAPENLLYLNTVHGITLIEMYPDFAPNHVQRMRDLASNGYFKGLPFHRVIKKFMAQAGDWNLVKRPAPTTPDLVGEFKYRRSPAQKLTLVGEDRNANTGFVDGFPVASQPDALAMMTADGKVRSWQLHCLGAAAMARTNEPNSANAQFYITTGYPEWLNGQYTAWGRVRAGQTAVNEIKLGEPAYPPDMIEGMRLGNEIAPEKRARVWVIRTDSAAFKTYLDAQKTKDGKLPGVCKIAVPVYVQWAEDK